MARLALFLTGGGSLARWRGAGLLSRELRLYLRYLESGVFERVTIFSYDAADRAILRELAEREPAAARIDLLAPRSGKGGAGWALSGVWRHRAALRQCAVFKTNQVNGAWAALWASMLTGRPLVFRLGYVLSRRLRFTGKRIAALAASAVEQATARRARAIVVSGESVAERFASDRALAAKLHVVPSFVDMTTFAARDGYDFDGPVIAVGRLHPNKNLPALIEACARERVALTLAGEGPERARLAQLAATLGAEVHFLGNVDNARLPAILREHAIFALPSLIEGLPKVLIEAMACGMLCVGSDIPGTADLIVDGETGYLIKGFSADDIAAAIRRARSEADRAIGGRARAAVERRFGLDAYVASEGALLLAAARR